VFKALLRVLENVLNVVGHAPKAGALPLRYTSLFLCFFSCFRFGRPVAVPKISCSLFTREILTAATPSVPFFRHRRRSPRSPKAGALPLRYTSLFLCFFSCFHFGRPVAVPKHYPAIIHDISQNCNLFCTKLSAVLFPELPHQA